MPLRALTLLAILLAMVSGVFLGVLGYQRWLNSGMDSEETDALVHALGEVQRAYVEPISDRELTNGALRGLVMQLDPHSVFLDSDNLAALKTQTTGRFGGVGIELGLRDGQPLIITPLDGGPAQRAGLRSGDRILTIDGWRPAGKPLREISERLRGEPDSKVSLDLARNNDRLAVELTRQIIALPSVTSRWLAPGIAYLRIAKFQTGTSQEFSRALGRLTSEPPAQPIEALVLDLRNNPGGVMQACVSVADKLLDEGLIVSTSGRQPSNHSRHVATPGDLLDGAPIVVLINGGTASAAEIVAGALKDHKRALILGSRSYGKGSVQSIVDLGINRTVKLTTAYYQTPSGRSIHQRGIEPDVYFEAQGRSGAVDPMVDEALRQLERGKREDGRSQSEQGTSVDTEASETEASQDPLLDARAAKRMVTPRAPA